MTDDLLRRARRLDTCIFPNERSKCLCGELADRIEKLEAALQWYAEHCQKGGDEIEGPFGDYGQRARKALEGEDD